MSQPDFEFFWATYPGRRWYEQQWNDTTITVGPYTKLSTLRGQLTNHKVKGNPDVKFYRTTAFEEFDPNG